MAASSASYSPSSRNPVFIWLFSSLGKKTVVAVTGLAMVGFVIGHLLGNLTIFLGPDWLNAYAVHLRELGPLLWVVRIGLLLAVGLHIYFTMLLWKENRAATPQKYAVFAPMQTTVYARTMRLGGLYVLAFVIFHLSHLTWGLVQPQAAHLTDAMGRHDVYAMAILGFRNPLISAIYISGLFFLCWHLNHGIASLFQTLGLTTQTMRFFYQNLARILAWVLFAGYISIPVAVLFFGLGKNIVP